MATCSSVLAWKNLWNLVGYNPWDHKESNTLKHTHVLTHTHTHTHTQLLAQYRLQTTLKNNAAALLLIPKFTELSL